jgi:hypothetical protein
MAKPQRLLLAGEARGARPGQIARQKLKIVSPLALGQRVLELELPIEMVLDDGLVASRDEDEVLDAGFPRLIHDMLNEGPIDDGQHLLGHGLGGRQESCTQPGYRKHGFPYWLHRCRA